MNLFCVGDVHGMIPEYQLLLERQIPENSQVVQVGDLGCGFVELPLSFFPHDTDVYGGGRTHKFIRGNHDSPQVARERGDYLGDYGMFMFEDASIFFMGGAWSIDHVQRSPGKDWWWDEQLGWDQLGDALDLYKEVQPDIVITHDAPTEVKSRVLSYLSGRRGVDKEAMPTPTDQTLQLMFEAHQPKVWVFGHYHVSWSRNIQGTEFRCLRELEVLNATETLNRPAETGWLENVTQANVS